MATIYKVSQLPSGDIPEGVIYYSRTTREILIKTSFGTRKFAAAIVPAYIDFIPINGYFPLLTSELLAKSYSPLGTATPYGLAELGPPPPGITYPVWMPDGRSDLYLGNYIDPLGDEDGDGIINFRDPDIIGLAGLPTANYNGDPFTTSNGSTINILDYLSNPDAGTFNNTDSDILIAVQSSGIMIGPNGEIKFFFGPGTASLPPGWTLFRDVGSTASPLPAPIPAYTGDPFITSSGASVNITQFLSNPDSGSLNNTGADIVINTINSGMIVCPDGSITLFLPGKVTVPNGCVLFRDLSNTSSPLGPPSPAYTGDPFVTSSGASVNILSYLSNPDSGSYNNTGGTLQIQVTEESIMVAPDGTVTVITPVPTTISLPPGYTLFSNQSSFVTTFTTSGQTPMPTPQTPVSTAVSLQWFEDDGSGNLILRSAEFSSTNPAVQNWEPSGSDSYMPRSTPYSSTTEDAQYFEVDGNGDITPTINPN